MRFVVLLALLPLVGGCLPHAGPSTAGIMASARETAPPFKVIALDPGLAELVSTQQGESFAAVFELGSSVPTLTIGVGDLVLVTIFEAAAGGLFSGEGALGGGTKSVSLPPQPVAQDGTIGVPYVGRVRAAGLRPTEVQANIEAALRDKAIQPQVVVTLAQSASASVMLAGEVATPGRVPLTLRGDRLLDVLVQAGGSRAPDYDSFVRVTRGNRSATVNLAQLIEDPAQNIYLRPDDLIYVYSEPRTFIAFGATGNATLPFEDDRLTLAQALGRVGGLSDSRADAQGVFVFRYEAPQVYAMLDSHHPLAATPAGVPVVYRINLRDPEGLFTTQRFLMRNNDILYVSNAPSTDLQKFLATITGNLGAAGSITSSYETFTTLGAE
jgi:polysaccharide export outer membrane protein